MDDLAAASLLGLHDFYSKAEEEEEEEDRASQVSSGRRSDGEEPDPSMSAPAAKRRKKITLDLSDVPADLPPIPSGKAGSASRFKGVTKDKKNWKAKISIPSEGGQIKLGTFDSEEDRRSVEAGERVDLGGRGIVSRQTKPCPLDLSEVPMSLPPIPSDKPGSAVRFKGVTKKGKKWQA